MRTTRPDPRQEGYDCGRQLAVSVTDLTWHTERLQVCEPRIPVTVPLDAAGRREWLHGYTYGIMAVLDEQAAL